jgi:16S rRNA (uracil1498-N3)-methyltransferase
MPRFFIDAPLNAGDRLRLPAGASRHVQVLRLQPGQELTLFNGAGGQWRARIERMERSSVTVAVLAFEPVEREPARRVHLALGVPANERMDWLVEKATELGAASLQPLLSAHSVLRLTGERAEKKRLHWLAVCAAACEQCGSNRLPTIEPLRELPAWLALPAPPVRRYVLSLQADARPLARLIGADAPDTELLLLSGPEGGLSGQEEEAARACGFVPASLGPRVLRAETAALSALVLALHGQPR